MSYIVENIDSTGIDWAIKKENALKNIVGRARGKTTLPNELSGLGSGEEQEIEYGGYKILERTYYAGRTQQIEFSLQIA